MSEPPQSVTWSLIIPLWRDAEALELCLDRLALGLSRQWEIIIVDATPATEAAHHQAVGRMIAHWSSRVEATVRWYPVPFVGRGAQMRWAVGLATGQWLVFHHADTEMTPAHLTAIESASRLPTAPSVTTFYRDMMAHYPVLSTFAWTARWARGLSRWWLRHWSPLYGDQTVAMSRQGWMAVGGMRPLPIMEDVELSRRIRQLFAPWQICLLDPPLRTSMRRFKKIGTLKNRLQNLALLCLWRAGWLDEHQIYQFYYGRKA